MVVFFPLCCCLHLPLLLLMLTFNDGRADLVLGARGHVCIQEAIFKSTGDREKVVFTSQPEFEFTRQVRSRLECVILCGRYIKKCNSFYIRKLVVNDTNGEGGGGGTNQTTQLECNLLTKRVSKANITVVPDDSNNSSSSEGGDVVGVGGTYGFVNNPPLLGTLQAYAQTHTAQGYVALYDCSTVYNHRVTNFGILLDTTTYRWPKLSAACASNLCLVPGLSATVLDIREETAVIVHCQAGETKHGDASCDTAGNWALRSPIAVGCLPTECYRPTWQSNKLRAVYKGTKTVSANGIECQRWDKTSPNWHIHFDFNFWVDSSMSAAENYCRDPDFAFEGVPWCYQMYGNRWVTCGVPECELAIV